MEFPIQSGKSKKSLAAEDTEDAKEKQINKVLIRYSRISPASLASSAAMLLLFLLR
jgi:hypothetical protein